MNPEPASTATDENTHTSTPAPSGAPREGDSKEFPVAALGAPGGVFVPMKTYAEKLKDPRWQRKRLEILQRDDFTCQSCHTKEKTLNVHHAHYSKGKSPWEYPSETLSTQCEDCHKKIETCIRLALNNASTSIRSAERLATLSWLANSTAEGHGFLHWVADSLIKLVMLNAEFLAHDDGDQQTLDDIRIRYQDESQEAAGSIFRALFQMEEAIKKAYEK